MNQETMVAVENLLYSMDMVGWFDLLHGMMRHGRLHRIGWCDASGYEVEDILRRYDIHAYGRGVHVELVPDGQRKRRVYHRWMYVNRQQANWTEYVLSRAGLALSTPMLDPRNVARAQRHGGQLPRPWMHGKRSKPASVIEMVFDWFGALLR